MSQQYENMSAKKGSGGGIADGQLDWGDNGGKLWECWVVEPCCDGYCCVTWWCCGGCNMCHMWAWSLDQECAIVNHCLPMWCCQPCAMCSMRNSIRNKMGIAAGGPMDGFIGDCLITWCCGSCSMCQQLRAAHKSGGKESWDFFGKPKPQVKVEPLKFPPFMN